MRANVHPGILHEGFKWIAAEDGARGVTEASLTAAGTYLRWQVTDLLASEVVRPASEGREEREEAWVAQRRLPGSAWTPEAPRQAGEETWSVEIRSMQAWARQLRVLVEEEARTVVAQCPVMRAWRDRGQDECWRAFGMQGCNGTYQQPKRGMDAGVLRVKVPRAFARGCRSTTLVVVAPFFGGQRHDRFMLLGLTQGGAPMDRAGDGAARREEAEKGVVSIRVPLRYTAKDLSEDTVTWCVLPLAWLISSKRTAAALLLLEAGAPWLAKSDFWRAVMDPTFVVLPNSARGNFYHGSEFVESEGTTYRDRDVLLRELTEKQRSCTLRFLKRGRPGVVEAGGESPVYVVQGPPGTGKSTMIATLLRLAPYELRVDSNFVQRRNARILVCAPSNQAVQVLASKYLSKFPEDTKCVCIVGVEDKLPPEKLLLRSCFAPLWLQRFATLLGRMDQAACACDLRALLEEARQVAMSDVPRATDERDDTPAKLVSLRRRRPYLFDELMSIIRGAWGKGYKSDPDAEFDRLAAEVIRKVMDATADGDLEEEEEVDRFLTDAEVENIERLALKQADFFLPQSSPMDVDRDEFAVLDSMLGLLNLRLKSFRSQLKKVGTLLHQVTRRMRDLLDIEGMTPEYSTIRPHRTFARGSWFVKQELNSRKEDLNGMNDRVCRAFEGLLELRRRDPALLLSLLDWGVDAPASVRPSVDAFSSATGQPQHDVQARKHVYHVLEFPKLVRDRVRYILIKVVGLSATEVDNSLQSPIGNGSTVLTIPDDLAEAFSRLQVASCDICFCTLAVCGRPLMMLPSKEKNPDLHYGIHHPGYDALVVDESAQAVEADTAIALALLDTLNPRCRVLLVGDPSQLPALVLSRRASAAGYDRSLMARHMNKAAMLDTQFRMHPAIAEFSCREYYGGRVRNAPSVLGEGRKAPWHAPREGCTEPWRLPFSVVNVSHGSERSAGGESFANVAEAMYCAQMLRKLQDTVTEVDPDTGQLARLNMGVITFYSGQVGAMERALRDEGVVGARVHTVDSFQGSEMDVIILSCVRANARGVIGFTNNFQRLNVALTRARRTLVVLCHANTFLAAGSLPERRAERLEAMDVEGSRGHVVEMVELIRHAQDRGVYFDTDGRTSTSAAPERPEDPADLFGRLSLGGGECSAVSSASASAGAWGAVVNPGVSNGIVGRPPGQQERPPRERPIVRDPLDITAAAAAPPPESDVPCARAAPARPPRSGASAPVVRDSLLDFPPLPASPMQVEVLADLPSTRRLGGADVPAPSSTSASTSARGAEVNPHTSGGAERVARRRRGARARGRDQGSVLGRPPGQQERLPREGEGVDRISRGRGRAQGSVLGRPPGQQERPPRERPIVRDPLDITAAAAAPPPESDVPRARAAPARPPRSGASAPVVRDSLLDFPPLPLSPTAPVIAQGHAN